MESTIRFSGIRRLQYIKIKKRVEDSRKGTDLIGLMHSLELNREKRHFEAFRVMLHPPFSFF